MNAAVFAPAAGARARLWQLLGELPELPVDIPGELLDDSLSGPMRVQRWRLALNAFEPVPALLTLPASEPPRAVVLYCHAHGGRFEIGKDELLQGRPALQTPPYGPVLAARGYAALAIDHWGFGARAHTSESALFKRWLWQGTTLWGLRVFDARAALTWIDTQPGLSKLPRIALGISMGSTLAWWTAALDERIAAVAELCCLAEFEALVDSGGYRGHAEYYFVPGLRREFTAASINALIAPRPHLSIAGRRDPLTPPAGLAAVDSALRTAYALAGAPQAWRQSVHEAGHEETPAMRTEVLAFVDAVIAG